MPASRSTTFEFASDATYADGEDCVSDYANARIQIGPFLCPLSVLQELHDTCRQLLDQPLDGQISTEQTIDTVTPPVVVQVASDLSTLTLGAHAPMVAAKAEGFIAGLTAHGLLP